MKKVRIKDRMFKVIPENKTVEGCKVRKDLASEVHGLSMKKRYILAVAIAVLTKNFDDIYATAYCDDRDKFDEETGIKICSAKLDLKNHLAIAKECDKIYRCLMECADYIYKKCENHMKKAQAIEDDMVRTYGRTPL